MSLQSDTEMLSVSAVEEYATQNHITVDAAYELFRSHQIFEKIILQHEYLHQVPFDEVMEFVNKEIQDKERDLILFHGTDVDFTEIQLNKSHGRRGCRQTPLQ